MSSEHNDQMDRRDKHFRCILAGMGTNLRARQDRVQLAPEIWKIERDLEYFRDQIEVLEAEAQCLAQEISAGEPELTALRSQMAGLHEEYSVVVGPFGPKCLEALEQTLARAMSDLSRIELRTNETKAGLVAHEGRIRERKSRLSHLQADTTKETVADLHSRRQVLEEEIQAITITLDLLSGRLPDDINPVLVNSIQNDLQDRLSNYHGEIQDNIGHISRHTETLQTEIKTCQTEKAILTNRKEDLTHRLLVLGQQIDDRQLDEALEKEIAEFHRSLAGHIKATTEVCQASVVCAGASSKIDQALIEIEAQLTQVQKRLDTLLAVQETLEPGVDLVATIAKLLDRSAALNIERRLKEALYQEARLLTNRLTQQQIACDTACEHWRQTVKVFDQTVAELIDR
ncbi:hypothetical protein DSUL_150113 [Desulfovibrionales bacterium]